MKKTFLGVNVVCQGLILIFLAVFLVNGLAAGYPWTIACYNCNICRLACPLGIDPHGFITSVLSKNPDFYITADRVRLTLKEAVELDPDMIIRIEQKNMKAGEAVSAGMRPDREIRVITMKAKHAAKYCFVCGNCTNICPIHLPVKDIIQDLADDGRFNG